MLFSASSAPSAVRLRRGVEQVGIAGLPVRVQRPRLSSAAQENLDGYVFILPWLVGFLGLTLGPMIISAYYSLCDYPLLSPPTFIGLGNFRELAHDPLIPQSLKVTFLYSISSIPLSMILAMALAMLLNVRVRGILIFRTIYYLPTILGGVAVSLIWMLLFSGTYGLFNYLLELVGLPPIKWLSSQRWALWALVARQGDCTGYRRSSLARASVVVKRQWIWTPL